MTLEEREASRIDLAAAGEAITRVFDRTGNGELYAERMVKLLLVFGTRKMLGRTIPEIYGEARLGLPAEWRPFLDPMFGFRGGVTEGAA